MITNIEIKGFKCLRYISVDLESFQILVGPNASGKSTFFDVLHLIGDILNVGLERAILGAPKFGIPPRVANPEDLTWLRQGEDIEFAVTAKLPDEVRVKLSGNYETCRYEIELCMDEVISFRNETLWICKGSSPIKRSNSTQRSLFPETIVAPKSIINPRGKKSPTGWRKVVNKVAQTGNDYFKSETSDWNNLFRLGPTKSALANLPEDEEKFPAATWFKRLLMEKVQRIFLNVEGMRSPSRPGSPRTYLPDGSNLPWVVYMLEKKYPEILQEWIEHVRTALPDLKSIFTIERPEDKSRYLVLRYRSGVDVPSWVVSDGTLRLLALTLLAYAPDPPKMILIEEPENGIHPRAVETVFQSLSSIYEAQVCCATHSPIVLSLTQPKQLLCFSRDSNGATDIIHGDRHPRLIEWKKEVPLASLFASGVLG